MANGESFMEDNDFREYIKTTLGELKEGLGDIRKCMFDNRDRITRLEATGTTLKWVIGFLISAIAALGGVIAKIIAK
jgi:hypothetical protein